MAVRSFSTTSRPACGRPPAAAVLGRQHYPYKKTDVHNHKRSFCMKVFISWSGDISHDVALALREWLPSVLQSVEPHVSSQDIEKGARWSAEIGRQLDETAFGILCVTADNAGAPWVNFEAGALSKSVDTSRVTPFLLGLREADLTGPLAQFQATLPNLDDVTKLIKSINAFAERPIDESRLIDSVQVWWPRLEERLNAASSKAVKPTSEQKRDTEEMVAELLEITRGMQRRLVTGGISFLRRYDPEKMAANPFGVNLDTPIEHLDLTVHSFNVLKRNGIDTLAKLTTTTEKELLSLRNMGQRNIEEIRGKLQMLRLDLSAE
jgi:Bacterial RNA polymerase, alpha chain C terminal domain/TIR domain